MTEFKHVTVDVTEIGDAIINCSKTWLYVNEGATGWSKAHRLAAQELERVDASIFYKTASRIYLRENHFQNSTKVETLEFWDELLERFSDVDSLPIHQDARSHIRKVLFDVIGHYIDADCVLLPMAAFRSERTPKWHAQSKPSITGHPYEMILNWFKEDCGSSNARLKRVGARYRFIFSSVRLPNLGSYTEDVDRCISEAIKDDLPKGHVTESARLLQVLASKCPAERGDDPFVTHLNVSSQVRRVPVQRENAKYSEAIVAVPTHNPILSMKTNVDKKLKGLGIKCRVEWVNRLEEWLSESSNSKILPLYNDVVFLCEWMAANGLSDRKPLELHRKDFVKKHDDSVVSIAFFPHLKEKVPGTHARARIVRNLVEFFAHCHDAWLEETGKVLPSPLNQSDKNRFPDTRAKERGKSTKPVLPRRIIEMGKQILLENDYAFSRRFDDQYVYIDSGRSNKKVFVPTISNVLYTILCLPIRTAQAVMLDSGEADEYIVTLNGSLARNRHPLARKGRKLGYARRYSGIEAGTQFSGMFINTNKETVHEQKGYEVPFHDETLMKVLASQRLFQEEFNPVNVLINRSQLRARDWRYEGAHVNQLESYTFLFRDIRMGSRRWDLPSRPDIDKLWLRLLQEIQSRLEEQDTPIQLVWENDKGVLRTDYTLHSLRVSNITHYIEAGVPLHVLAEFLSGHQSLVMTLYYTKLGPQRIHEVIAEASKNLAEADEDQFFDRLTQLSEDLLGENVVGRSDGLARLPSGDPGLWHVDLDGFCTAGKSQCHEGLERRDPESGKVSYERIDPDGFNCALCRFHVTGPVFLAGQVTVVNTLFYSISDRSEQQDKLFHELTEARKRGNNLVARRVQDKFDKVKVELEQRVAALGARIGNIYASLNIMNTQDEEGSDKTALITKLDTPDIEARLAKATNFQVTEWAAQAVEFFPEIPDHGARFRKGMLLEMMAERNGVERLLLHLSHDEQLRAGNRLTAMMADLYGQAETDDLISGKITLEELGGMEKFKPLVGRAIEISRSNVSQIPVGQLMIGVEDE